MLDMFICDEVDASKELEIKGMLLERSRGRMLIRSLYRYGP
jgi:hypothetical protein